VFRNPTSATQIAIVLARIWPMLAPVS
jgi:hypothetical protein